MGITKRMFFLAVLGVLLVMASFLWGIHLYVFVGWNVLLAGLYLLDILLTPRARKLTVRREGGASGTKMYFKDYNQVNFHVMNRAYCTLWVQAKDEVGRHFTLDNAAMTHKVPAHGNAAFCYLVIPTKRGAFTFEYIHLRWRGVLGLCMKYAKIPCPMTFKVYPNMRDLSKFRLMMQKTRLLPTGDKIVRQFGTGTEFESLRSYVPGDDYRKINWPATARENKLMVNQYQIERNQPVYILLDAGRPMSYSVGGYKKLDYAINAALMLGDIVNQQGDQVGLLVFDQAVKAHITPGKGAAHRHLLMETLYHVEDSRQTANYEGAFAELCRKQKRRGLVFIFTDVEMLEEAEGLINHIALLKKRHMPIVVFMANEGLTALTQDSGRGQEARILRETARDFAEERQQIFHKLNALRIPNIESTAEHFALAAVNRYIQLRK